MKAVAEKLIPGIPIQTRISILQQTSTSDPNAASTDGSTATAKSASSSGQMSVLETVIDGATSRNDIQQEIDGSYIIVYPEYS